MSTASCVGVVELAWSSSVGVDGGVVGVGVGSMSRRRVRRGCVVDGAGVESWSSRCRR